MQKRKNLVLIGMSGCGKTTIGRALSYRLKMPFIDMDAWVEKAEGRTIPQIFAEDGEEYFRLLETQMAQCVSREHGTLISTGGGVILREENMKYLKKHAVVVYLNRSAEDIAKRIRTDNRPLLKDHTEALFSMYEVRHPLYRKYADIEVENRGSFQNGLENVYQAVKDKI